MKPGLFANLIRRPTPVLEQWGYATFIAPCTVDGQYFPAGFPAKITGIDRGMKPDRRVELSVLNGDRTDEQGRPMVMRFQVPASKLMPLTVIPEAVGPHLDPMHKRLLLRSRY